MIVSIHDKHPIIVSCALQCHFVCGELEIRHI